MKKVTLYSVIWFGVLLVFMNVDQAKTKNLENRILELEKEVESLEIRNSIVYLTEDEYREVEELPIPEVVEVEEVEICIDSSDLRLPSNITETQLKKVLDNTKLSGLEKHYIQAEKDLGVNAVFLCALTIQESGWGKSNLAVSRNNLGGIKAGSNYRAFNSKVECINYMGKLIANNYLASDGKYHSGVSIESVNKRYAVLSDGTPNYDWSNKIKNIMLQIKEENNE